MAFLPRGSSQFLFLVLLGLGLLVLFMVFGGSEVEAEEVAFYQAGGFGGAYKNTHYDGQYLYATHYQGMSIFDMSDADEPEEIGFVLTSGFAYGLWVEGRYAYIGNGYDGLLVVDISDKRDPRIVGEAPNEWFASGVFVEDGYAYVADGYFQLQDEGGLLIYDVSEPSTPQQVGKYSTNVGGPNEVVVIDDYAYVADGQNGLLILDVSNKEMPVRVSSFDTSYATDLVIRGDYAYVTDRTGGLVIIDHSFKQLPAQVGSYDTEGEAWGLDLVGDYAHITDFDYGLAIIDVSNPNLPQMVSDLDTDGLAMKVTVVDDMAYIADNTNGLIMADVSQVSAPALAGHFDTAGSVMDVELADGYVYVCDGDRLFILEATDVTYPKAVGFYEATGNGGGEGVHIAVRGDYAYLANGEAGLVILDLSDRSDPRQVGQADTDGLALDVFVAGDHAYVVDGENGLVIIDVTDPLQPQQVGHYDTNDIARRIKVRDDLAYVGDRFEDLQILDVSDPMDPTFVGNWTSEDGHVNGVALSGDYAYLSTGSEGLRIIDISDPSDPVEVGDYPTDGWAMLGVNVIGHHALLGDNLNGVVIVNVEDPTDPVMEFHYDTPDASSVIEVLGNFAFVADRYNGLVIGEVTGLAGGTPRAIIESISPRPAYSDEKVRLVASASGGSGQYDRYVWRSNLDGELYDGGEDSFTHEGFSVGSHTIYMKVRDSEGSWSYEERRGLEVGHRPAVKVDSPDNESVVIDTVTFEGSASDGDGNETLERVELAVDEDGWMTVEGTESWSYDWDSQEAEDGEHTFRFRSWDDQGHSHEALWTLTVNNDGGNLPPTVDIQDPDDSAVVSGTLTIRGTASDRDGDETLERVELSIDGGTWSRATGTTSWELEWDTTIVSEGAHTITARAYDGENHSKEVRVTVTVANGGLNVRPSMTIEEPVEGQEVSGVITISGIAEDPDGQVNLVELTVDGGDWLTVQGTSSWSFELDTRDLDNGEHTLTLRAYDGTDHSDEVSLSIEVQNQEVVSTEGDDDIDWTLWSTLGFGVVLIALAGFIAYRKQPAMEDGSGVGAELEGWDEVPAADAGRSLPVACPHCGQQLAIPAGLGAQTLMCSNCHGHLKVEQ